MYHFSKGPSCFGCLSALRYCQSVSPHCGVDWHVFIMFSDHDDTANRSCFILLAAQELLRLRVISPFAGTSSSLINVCTKKHFTDQNIPVRSDTHRNHTKIVVFVFFFFVAFTHKIPLLANRFRTVDPDVDSTNMRSAVVCNRFIYHGGQGKWRKGSSLVLFAGPRGGSIRWEKKPLLATDCGSRLDCQMSFVQVPARIRWKKYEMGQKKNGFREPWDLGEQDIPVAKSHPHLLPLPGHHGKLLYCFCVGDCHRSPLATYSNWMDDWVFIGEPSISMIRDDGELEPRNRPSFFFSLFGNIRTKKNHGHGCLLRSSFVPSEFTG